MLLIFLRYEGDFEKKTTTKQTNKNLVSDKKAQ